MTPRARSYYLTALVAIAAEWVFDHRAGRRHRPAAYVAAGLVALLATWPLWIVAGVAWSIHRRRKAARLDAERWTVPATSPRCLP